MLKRLFLFAVVSSIFMPIQARASEPLVADLSSHLIAITTGFTGTELLLFGTTKDDGDVVVVVRGPNEEVVVRKKDRIAGIWMNSDGMIFNAVPAFYYVAATEGVEFNLPIHELRRHQIGVDNIRMTPPIGRTDSEVAEFQESIVRLREAAGLYTGKPGLVEKRGQRLFRTKVLFPSNVPVGTYIIETLLVRNGTVESAQTTPLFVSKVGSGAEIFLLAQNHGAIFGILSILIAVLAGYGANWLFKRIG
ncbi:MAG: TIGR02186 family protein [Alphaproteobacteria bacterium]